MKESVGELIHKVGHLGPKAAVNGGAGAATLTPQPMFGEFLNTNGVWLLSYSEWIKVIGAIWVTILIVEALVKHTKSLIKKGNK